MRRARRCSTDAPLAGPALVQYAVRRQGTQGLVHADWISQGWATSRKLQLRGIVVCRLRAATPPDTAACMFDVRDRVGSKHPGGKKAFNCAVRVHLLMHVIGIHVAKLSQAFVGIQCCVKCCKSSSQCKRVQVL